MAYIYKIVIYFWVKFFTRLIACSVLGCRQFEVGHEPRAAWRSRAFRLESSGAAVRRSRPRLLLCPHACMVSARAGKLKLAAHGAVGGNTRPDKPGLCCTDKYPFKIPFLRYHRTDIK